MSYTFCSTAFRWGVSSPIRAGVRPTTLMTTVGCIGAGVRTPLPLAEGGLAAQRARAAGSSVVFSTSMRCEQ